MKIISKILSRYTKIENTPNGIAIQCPFCRVDGKKKEFYFYHNGVNMCFRCKDTKGKTYSNAWEALNELLLALGVKDPKIHSFHRNLNYVDYGESIIEPLTQYDAPDFIPGENSPEVGQYLRSEERNFIPEKVEQIQKMVKYGTKGLLKGRICVPLYPTGYQGRDITGIGSKYKTWKPTGETKHSIYTPIPNKISDEIFIVEGPFDCLTLFQYGFDSIALLGTKYSPYVGALLQRKQVEKIYVWLDPDPAGKNGYNALIQKLISDFYDVYTIEYNKEPGNVKSRQELEEALSYAEPIALVEIFD